jgi:putative intracellular protease/amidase
MADGMSVSILIVLDAVDELETDPLEDFVGVYYTLLQAGARLLIASESGGYPWLRRPKAKRRRGSDLVDRFLSDRHARDEFADTLRLRDIFVEDFSACILVGGTGFLLGIDRGSAGALAGEFLRAGKPVAAVSRKVSFMPEGTACGLALFSNGGSSLPAAVRTLLSALQEGDAPRGSR